MKTLLITKWGRWTASCLAIGLLVFVGLFINSHTRGGAADDIVIISRENGSGTRSSFVDIVELLDQYGDDDISIEADVLNSTIGVLETVAKSPMAIGYVSYGVLTDQVKALKIDGVEMSVETIKNGDYHLSRPFSLVWSQDLSELGQDFVAFVYSQTGRQILADQGHLAVGSLESLNQASEEAGQAQAYQTKGLEGELSLGGSTSMVPLMERLIDAYQAQNPAVAIDLNAVGSTAGIEGTKEGVLDIGLTSRQLTQEEAEVLTYGTFAKDGIAIIVHPESQITNMTIDQLKAIFQGEITTWEGLLEIAD